MKGEHPAFVKRMLEYMYNLDYDGVVYADEDADVVGNEYHSVAAALMLPLDMHVAADKYDVRGLKEVSALKFRQAMCAIPDDLWGVSGAIAVIKDVYESTNPGDDAIRSVINSLVFKNLTVLMGNDAFRGLLAEHPDLAVSVLYLCSQATPLGNCQNCQNSHVYCAVAHQCPFADVSGEHVKRMLEDEVQTEGAIPAMRGS